MKKRIWSLLLCMILVTSCFTGCGKGKADDKGSKPAPEDYVTSKFNDYADEVTKWMDSSTGSAPASTGEGTGLDISLSLAIGRQVAAAYGMAGLENISLLLGYDAKGSMQGIAEVSLNGKSVLEANVYVDKESILVNLPKYSRDYMELPMEDMLGMSLEEYAGQMAKGVEGKPTAEEMKALWIKYSQKFIDCFTYESHNEGSDAGTGAYTFKAEEYVVSADAKDIQALAEELLEDLKKYPALELENVEIEDCENTKFYCHYYEGKDGQYAWKFSDSENDKSAVTFISAGKGFCLYTEEDGEEEAIIYSVKESDRKGKVVLVDEGTEYIFNYDNYTKDSVDISGEMDGVAFTVSIEKKNNQFYADFSISTYGFVVSGKLEGNSSKVGVTASVDYQGINFGTLVLECKNRDFAEFTMPSGGVDQDTWTAGLDEEALYNDMMQLAEDYPFLAQLLIGIEPLEDD